MQRKLAPIGETFERWVVLHEVLDLCTPVRVVRCQCSCGTLRNVKLSSLYDKSSRSCGCLQREDAKNGKYAKTHGFRGKRIYNIWKGILARCRTKNTKSQIYKTYAARGITFDPYWSKFENFYSDMGESYEIAAKEFGEKSISIDRIDSDGNYCKKNCRWATRSAQCFNRSMARLLTFNGETMALGQWAQRVGISEDAIYQRLSKLNWSVEKALTVPVKHKKNKEITNEEFTTSRIG